MSTTEYPPVVGPSLEQNLQMKITGQLVPRAEWSLLLFSAEFRARYGLPVPDFQTWARLMNATYDKNLVPRYDKKWTFEELTRKISFLDFCKRSDQIAVRTNARVLGRRELEGAWCQELVFVFDRDNGDEDDELASDPDVMLREKQGALYRALRRRYTSKGIRQYWESKRDKYGVPDLDVEYIPEYDLTRDDGMNEYAQEAEGDAGGVVNTIAFQMSQIEMDNEVEMGGM